MKLKSTAFRLFLLFFINILTYGQSKILNENQIKSFTEQSLKEYNSGNFEKSIITIRKALNSAQKSNNNELIAKCYLMIGRNLEILDEPSKTIEYDKKALYYANKTENYRIRNTLYNQLGIKYHEKKKDFVTANFYFNKALDIAESKKDTMLLVITKLNYGLFCFDKNDYKALKENIDFLNVNFPVYGNSQMESIFFVLNAKYAQYQKNNNLAKQYFSKALALNNSESPSDNYAYLCKEYSVFLKNQKRFEEAFFYLDKSYKINLQDYDKNRIQRSKIEAINFQLDDYKFQIQKAILVNKIQEVKNEKSNITITFLIIMLIVLMLLIISLFRMNSLKVANNITLLDKNKELEIANKKAVESSKIKSQFVSTISHELRTPLYGVIGITNLLTDEHPELTNSKHLKSLEFSANYLLSLVNDILHINKIEENKSTIEKQNFDIYQEINLIRDSLFFIAKTNNNQFEINIDNDLPNNLLGDKVRLDQILMNLISNALKFTKNGIIKININLNKIVNNYYYLDFEVADNGVGIAKEDQIKVFEKFVQVGQNNDDYQGTGLGLAIVKNLINLFDSKLFLESELGKGTSFKFTIKLEKSLENNKILIVDDNKFNNLNINVLVVDDNKINQAVTKKILESKNSRCTILYDGFEAATLLQTNQFDIILMDINMPKINGYDTTKMIRQNGITTPIIALTAYSKDEISDKVFESGMNDILIKPFQPNKLFEIILKNLDKKNAG